MSDSSAVGVYLFLWYLPVMVKVTVLINGKKDLTMKGQSYFMETICKFGQNYEFYLYPMTWEKQNLLQKLRITEQYTWTFRVKGKEVLGIDLHPQV